MNTVTSRNPPSTINVEVSGRPLWSWSRSLRARRPVARARSLSHADRLFAESLGTRLAPRARTRTHVYVRTYVRAPDAELYRVRARE